MRFQNESVKPVGKAEVDGVAFGHRIFPMRESHSDYGPASCGFMGHGVPWGKHRDLRVDNATEASGRLAGQIHQSPYAA